MSDSLKTAIHSMEKIKSPTPAQVTFINLLHHLKDVSLKVDIDMDRLVVHFGTAGDEGPNLSVLIQVDEDREYFLIVSVSTITCKRNQRRVMADLLCRINYKMALGSFDLDMRDGEIRYRVGQKFGSSPAPKDVIEHCLGLSLIIHERYAKTLTPLCLGFPPKPEDMVDEYKEMLESPVD